MAGATNVSSAEEGESISFLDEVGTSQLISGPSWLWSDYPDLAKFLRAQKNIFFRHPDDQYTTDLTICLISFAGSKGYHFECLRDYEKVDEDLPTAVENMRGFQTLRERVRKYMAAMKETYEASSSSSKCHEDNGLNQDASQMSLGQTAPRKSTRKRRTTDPSQYLQETASFTARGCARPHLNFYWRPSTPEKRGRNKAQKNVSQALREEIKR